MVRSLSLLASLSGIALLPLLAFGPPRLVVSAGSPGEPITVRVEHSGEVDHINMRARLIQRIAGERVERDASLVERAMPAGDVRVFELTPRETRGEPAIVLIRGTHGADGPFMESLVRLDAAGAVVGIRYSKRTSMLGGSTFPPFSEREITAALRAVEEPLQR